MVKMNKHIDKDNNATITSIVLKQSIKEDIYT